MYLSNVVFENKSKSKERWRHIIGKIYNRLCVLDIVGVYEGKSYALCKCECGELCHVNCSKIENGHTKSCGCIGGYQDYSKRKGKKLKSHFVKHGQAKRSNRSPLYKIWQGMIGRCYTPTKSYYWAYGGRGIEVCDEWHYNYEAFEEWAITHGYNEEEHFESGKNKLTLDRIDVNGNYEPSNCRWVDWKKQSSNKRTIKEIEQNKIDFLLKMENCGNLNAKHYPKLRKNNKNTLIIYNNSENCSFPSIPTKKK